MTASTCNRFSPASATSSDEQTHQSAQIISTCEPNEQTRLRREMYERIARGHAMAEVEALSRRRLHR
jgi:hypothetical protein